MKILSLFDGMSCGQIALNRIGVKVELYLASEIDKHAIRVTQSNYPNTVQLGNVQNIGSSSIAVDLLLAGSPCQDFSIAGKPDRKGLGGKRSGLFWEFVRILKELRPKYFLLENVKMFQEWQNIITEALGVEPININSNLVSAQNRDRLYWTNIPNITPPNDRDIMLKDIIDVTIPLDRPRYTGNYKSGFPIPISSKKFQCLRANAGCKTQGIGICAELGNWRKLTPNECEKLQTVPIDYTLPVISSGIKSSRQRYKMLGNGWTIDIIAHILKNIPEI
jgi:DNA-cytosine methyltransferase